MEYEKKYKEIIGKIRTAYLYAQTDSTKAVLEEIFPELKESEDEQHRRWILEYLYDGLQKSDEQFKDQFKSAISWLEKQESVGEIVSRCKTSWYNEGKIQGQIEGLSDEEKYQQGWHDALKKQDEQSKSGVQGDYRETLFKIATVLSQHEDREGSPLEQIRSIMIDGSLSAMDLEDKELKKNEQKPVDKVEPKFEIEEGKWYICIRDLLDSYANRAFCKGDIYLSTQNGSLIPSNSNVPFRIVCPDTYFKDWTIQDAKDGDVLVASDDSIFIFAGMADCACKYYVALTNFNEVKINKKAEGGYWETSRAVHPATKEQCDILFQKMREEGYEWNAESRTLKKIEQKSTDEEMKTILQTEYEKGRADVIAEFHKEWSEDDEQYLLVCKNALEKYQITNKWDAHIIFRWLENKLKSLIPQNTWKPSDEHLKALKDAIHIKFSENPSDSPLWRLYEQLKKLKGE